jgi:hypothetical protein
LFPKEWTSLKSLESSQEYDCEFDNNDIELAFNRLLQSGDLKNKYRFCFFIDALDEHQETTSEDHVFLVKLLTEWVAKASGVLKLCVSSREDSVFISNLNPEARLELQKLTWDDMMCYCRDRLQDCASLTDLDRLVEKFVEESQGVFLWLALVTMNVRRGLENDWDLPRVEQELKRLPTEIGELYNHLFASIPEPEKRRADQIFAMVLEFEPRQSKLFSLACLYLDDFEKDAQFATRNDLRKIEPILDGLNEDQVLNGHIDRANKAQKLVRRYCKGLVEVRICCPTGNSPWGLVCRPRVKVPQYVLFVHRSAVEFLQKRIKTASEHLDKSTIIETISQTHLAAFIKSPNVDPTYWEFLHADIISMRALSGIDHSPYVYLERLTSAVELKYPERSDNNKCRKIPFQVTTMTSPPNVAFDEVTDSDGTVNLERRLCRFELLTVPIYLAACHGVVGYVYWKLEQSPEVAENSWMAFCLLQCLHQGLQINLGPNNLEIYQYCIEKLLHHKVLESTEALSSVYFFYCAVRSIKGDAHMLHPVMRKRVPGNPSQTLRATRQAPTMDKKFALWFIEMYLRKVEALNLQIILRNTACTLDSEEDPDLLSASQFLNQGHHDDLKRRNPWLHAPRKGLYNEQVTQPLSVRQYFECLGAPYPEAVFEYLESAYAPLEDIEEKPAVAPLAKFQTLGTRASGFIQTAWNTFPQPASTSQTTSESPPAPDVLPDNLALIPKRLDYPLKLHRRQWNQWIHCSIIVVVAILGMLSYIFLDPILTRARVHRHSMRDDSLSVWLEMIRQKSWTCVWSAFVLERMFWEGCELFCIVPTFDISPVCYNFVQKRFFPNAYHYFLRIILLKSSFDSS